MSVNSHIGDVIDLLIQDAFGQAERWNLRTHHSTPFVPFIEKMDFIPFRGQVAGDGEGRWSSTDKSHFFAIFNGWCSGHQGFDFSFVVRGHPFEAADGYRFFILLDSSTPARWFTGPVTGTTQDTGKHIGFPVDH